MEDSIKRLNASKQGSPQRSNKDKEIGAELQKKDTCGRNAQYSHIEIERSITPRRNDKLSAKDNQYHKETIAERWNGHIRDQKFILFLERKEENQDHGHQPSKRRKRSNSKISRNI